MNEIVATSQSIEPQQTEASSLSSNEFNALLYGYNWRSSDITFSIINEVDSSFSNDYLSDNLNNLVTSRSSFSPAQAEAISTALIKWSNVTSINFTEVKETDNSFGTLRFGLSDYIDALVSNSSAFAFFPSNIESGGDIWLNANTKDILDGKFIGTFSESTFQRWCTNQQFE